MRRARPARAGFGAAKATALDRAAGLGLVLAARARDRLLWLDSDLRAGDVKSGMKFREKRFPSCGRWAAFCIKT